VYEDLTPDGSSQEGRQYRMSETKRQIAIERIIQSQVKSAREKEPRGGKRIIIVTRIGVHLFSEFCLEFRTLRFLVIPDS